MRSASAARRGARSSSSTDGIWRSRSDFGVDATGVFHHRMRVLGRRGMERLAVGTGPRQRKYGADMGEIQRAYR